MGRLVAVTLASLALTVPAGAAGGGSTPEIMAIYDLYERGEHERADALIAPLVAAGDPDALGVFGIVNLLGIGGTADPEYALELCEQAAAAEAPMGLHCMGHIYTEGTDALEPDGQLATYWWAKGTAAGDLESMFHLSENYLGGVGIAADEEEALRLLRHAADHGEKYAAYSLGHMYGSWGSPVGRDLARKHGYWRAILGTVAAEPHVRLWLGAYELDVAATQEEADAAAAIIEAEAAAGYPPAQLRLAYICLAGVWRARDLRCAREWYARTEEYEDDAPGVYFVGQVGLTLAELGLAVTGGA